ncbi:OLC1v1031910C1 [Oldenlandia corymbosa var. corymbosa]|uniref:OLC1v1031910C1 n=1 Tax=Oldenlandia corymbosa var. corymbosa TaxID=529605 RepID=A0AAV1CLM7_OLDCO|nr:OLC1v1031910C1 [Oldenlandia corymbosa var. corymbosa]
MASKSIKLLAFLLLLNLICFTLVSACAPTRGASCPENVQQLKACAGLLGSSSGECCSLIGGLADLEATACLCTAVRANVFNLVELDIPVRLGLILNGCGKTFADGYKCV